jgi:hypothetical protein
MADTHNADEVEVVKATSTGKVVIFRETAAQRDSRTAEALESEDAVRLTTGQQRFLAQSRAKKRAAG